MDFIDGLQSVRSVADNEAHSEVYLQRADDLGPFESSRTFERVQEGPENRTGNPFKTAVLGQNGVGREVRRSLRQKISIFTAISVQNVVIWACELRYSSKTFFGWL